MGLDIDVLGKTRFEGCKESFLQNGFFLLKCISVGDSLLCRFCLSLRLLFKGISLRAVGWHLEVRKIPVTHFFPEIYQSTVVLMIHCMLLFSSPSSLELEE